MQHIETAVGERDAIAGAAPVRHPAPKLTSRKQAASALVTKITADPKADVKIAVIPYGQYVNIGVANRNQARSRYGAKKES